jgi:hypothetical protein
MISEEEIGEFLAHYGVLGMKWGVRRSEQGSGRSSRSPAQGGHARLKKAAVTGGIVVAAALVASGAYYASRNGGLSVSELTGNSGSKTADAGRKFAENLSDPIGPIHFAAGRNVGNRFLMNGGLKDPYPEIRKSGLDEDPGVGYFRRYGSRNEKVAAVIRDPEGRRDRATRPITHMIIVPESMAKGLNSAEDVERVVWPQIRDQYSQAYEAPVPENPFG